VADDGAEEEDGGALADAVDAATLAPEAAVSVVLVFSMIMNVSL